MFAATVCSHALPADINAPPTRGWVSFRAQCNEPGLCFLGRRSLLGVLLGCRLEKAVRFRRSNMALQIALDLQALCVSRAILSEIPIRLARVL